MKTSYQDNTAARHRIYERKEIKEFFVAGFHRMFLVILCFSGELSLCCMEFR